MTVHVCAPAPESVWLVREMCFTCGTYRRFVVAFYTWYGPESTCLRCGEKWNEDGRQERPFLRGWRKESIRRAWETYRRWRNHDHT